MGTAIDPNRVIGHKVVDAEGHKIGQAEEVYLDDSTGLPQWVTVKGGLFGGKEHFAPLDGATLDGDEVQLSCAKSLVDGAPELETGRHLSVEEERALYQHYGLGRRDMSQLDDGTGRSADADTLMGTPGTGTAMDTGMDTGTGMGTGMGTGTGGAGTGAAAGMGAAGMGAAGMTAARRPGSPAPTRAQDSPTVAGTAGATDRMADPMAGRMSERPMEAGDSGKHSMLGRAMTRFEERLHIGTERTEAGHARLRKQVSTEQVRQTVPLTHQEVRIEREPIRPEEAAAMTSEDTMSEAESEVTLYAERTVVSKHNVPVERVRMRVEDVTEEVVVTEEVRTERIDLESDGTTGSGGTAGKEGWRKK